MIFADGIFITIQSAKLYNYLRMNGSGVKGPTPPGGGRVTTQTLTGSEETLEVVDNKDGTISLRSTDFGECYLRMDGRGVTSYLPAGGGEVNCQGHIGPWEKLKVRRVLGGKYAIESDFFPGVYLSMGNNGVVNCQYGAYGNEHFIIWQRI